MTDQGSSTPQIEKLSKLTARLVSIPSMTHDTKACSAVIDCVENLFHNTAYRIERFELSGVHSLIVSKTGGMEFDCIFNGHLDVVPAEESGFIPRIEEGRLYGRGAADMKGSCAAMIQLFLDHEETGLLDSAALVLTTDEEVGGEHGVGYLVNTCGLKAPVVIVPDGGEAFTPCIFEKGILHFELRSEGTAAHGSRPWLGKNAVENLMDDINVLRSKLQKATAESEWDVSMNVGRMHCDGAINAVPTEATAGIDIRFPATLGNETLLDIVRSSVEHSEVRVIALREAVAVDELDPVYQMFCDALADVGHHNKGIKEHGGSDASFFVPHGSSILIVKPLSSPFHVRDEWVDIESLYSLYQVFERFIMRRYQAPQEERRAVNQ